MPSAIFKDHKGRDYSIKDPDATLDYTFDWSAWLSEVGDTIVSAEFFLKGDLVMENQDSSSTAATVFVSGGSACKEAAITCRITTQGGRIDDRTLILSIKEL